MKESQIKERIKQGWIRAIVTFEVAGKPAQHIEESLTKYLANIKADDRIVIIEEAREPAVAHDDGMFSTFAECDMLARNLETFTWLCINFSPASIEIIEPDDLVLPQGDITNWLNDLLAKVHEIGTTYRSHKSGNEHLTQAMNALIKNAVLLSLRGGERDIARIAKDTGILAEQLKPFLEHLMEKDQILESQGKYRLADLAARTGVLPLKKKGAR